MEIRKKDRADSGSQEKHMTVLYAVLLGIIQGITEFLPVSSFGHLCIAQKLLGMQRGPGGLLEVMLHVGTLYAVITVFRRDLRKVARETIGMAADLMGNIHLYVHNRRTGDDLRYARIVNSTYRKLATLLLVSMIPTAILGYTARRLVVKSAASPMIPGIGLLITGVVLLVTDASRSGGKKTLRGVGYDSAMWIGICQGISVFPGLSRSGLTMCAALLCGFSRTFAVKYSYMLSVPAIIGAMILEAGNFTASGMTVGRGFICILGAVTAGITGRAVIRFLLKIVHRRKFRFFAYYCFLAGALTLIENYAM